MEPLEQEKHPSKHRFLSFFKVFLALLLFIFAIDLLTVAMGKLNNEVGLEILQITSNPFISLFIGLLVTALIQSSSTVTASVVAIVASGNLTLQQAVPLVLGANIGTTLTSTLVSFSFIMFTLTIINVYFFLFLCSLWYLCGCKNKKPEVINTSGFYFKLLNSDLRIF